MRAIFAGKGAMRLLLLSALALGAAVTLPPLFAQTAAPSKPSAPQQAPAHKHHRKAKAAPVAEPPPPPQPTVAPNLLEQPAAPATVTTGNNELTVKADNSSLAQILHQVSSKTGMKLDGMSSDERVFGSFGPAAPREVLTALLNGTSYNLIMVGDLPNGAPRELLLSRRSGGSAPPMPAAAANNNGNPSQDQDQNAGADDNSTDDTSNSGNDDTDESAPPMQYTPPSITPAEPTPPTPRTIPQMRMQAAPPQQQ